MNTFKLISTEIVKSNMDFTKVSGAVKEYNADCEVTVSVGVPKDPSKLKSIRCIVELTFGGSDSLISIYMKSVSMFEITGEAEENTLRQDANTICKPKALEEMSARLSKLTSLHIGKPFNIPLSLLDS